MPSRFEGELERLVYVIGLYRFGNHWSMCHTEIPSFRQTTFVGTIFNVVGNKSG
jgi:hypothetical protein